MSSPLIERPDYIDKLQSVMHTPDVKVLVGIRRSGKSSILRMFADGLMQQGVKKNNIYFKRLDAFDTPLDYNAEALYADLTAAIKNSDDTAWFYVFLDEIQDVPGWEQIVRRLHTREHTDVYITGSNAHILSSELATKLTGRYHEIPVFPLSYNEYRTFVGQRLKLDSKLLPTPAPTLADYLRFGGMPGIFELRSMNQDDIASLLSAILESILFSDVASRLELRSTPSLERVVRFLIGTSGSLCSLRNITNTLKSSGISLDIKTVDALIQGLISSFIIYPAAQQGIRGKAVLRPQHKYYPADTGLRSLISGFGTTDIGARLEGVVFMELKRRGYEVSVGTMPNSEVDFVASSNSDRLYIQVTDSMLDESTRRRELAPLESLTDAYRRIILTADQVVSGTITDTGIQIINLEQWLLGDK